MLEVRNPMGNLWGMPHEVQLRGMFCGIVQRTGTIEMLEYVSGLEDPEQEGARLVVRCDGLDRAVPVGGSVAHDGICLTLVEPLQDHLIKTFLGRETLAVTTASDWQVGQQVNLEPAMCAGDPIGGHFVSGHVDDVITVTAIEDSNYGREIWLSLTAEWLPYVAPKGSIALDGISLTVNEVTDSGLRVNLIPHTLEITTMGQWQVGDRVNMEIDPFARQIVHALQYLRPAGDTAS